MSGSIGGAKTQGNTNEWYTPEWVFKALGLTFDLDPSSPHGVETCVPATRKYTIFDNGLKKEWSGRVWLNPPYGREIVQWVDRMIDHKNGIALVFSRTDSDWCQRAMHSADAVLFLSGRIEFIAGQGQNVSRAAAGSMLLAWGDDCKQAVVRMAHLGFIVGGAA
jgi:phage N-6-adenine-methyltransferase